MIPEHYINDKSALPQALDRRNVIAISGNKSDLVLLRIHVLDFRPALDEIPLRVVVEVVALLAEITERDLTRVRGSGKALVLVDEPVDRLILGVVNVCAARPVAAFAADVLQERRRLFVAVAGNVAETYRVAHDALAVELAIGRVLGYVY